MSEEGDLPIDSNSASPVKSNGHNHDLANSSFEDFGGFGTEDIPERKGIRNVVFEDSFGDPSASTPSKDLSNIPGSDRGVNNHSQGVNGLPTDMNSAASASSVTTNDPLPPNDPPAQPYTLTAPEDFTRGRVKNIDLVLDTMDTTMDDVSDDESEDTPTSTNTSQQHVDQNKPCLKTSQRLEFNNETTKFKELMEEDKNISEPAKVEEDFSSDNEVSFKKQEDPKQAEADVPEMDEVKLMAQILCDLNSDPVVILGHDRLTDEEVKLFSKRL